MARQGTKDFEELSYLRGLLSDLFRRPQRRRDRNANGGLALQEGDLRLELETPQEVAAACVGSMLLLLVQEQGGCALEPQALRGIARRSLDSLAPPDRALVTEEITRVLDWLGNSLTERGGSAADSKSWGDVHYDSAPYVPVIEQALEAGQDVEIEYFSYNRGEWSERRVTPERLERRSVLVGHCHLRGTERRFRLSRIRRITVLSA